MVSEGTCVFRKLLLVHTVVDISFISFIPDCHVEMYVFHGMLVLSLALELELEIVARQSVSFIPLAWVQM